MVQALKIRETATKKKKQNQRSQRTLVTNLYLFAIDLYAIDRTHKTKFNILLKRLKRKNPKIHIRLSEVATAALALAAICFITSKHISLKNFDE